MIARFKLSLRLPGVLFLFVVDRFAFHCYWLLIHITCPQRQPSWLIYQPQIDLIALRPRAMRGIETLVCSNLPEEKDIKEIK